MDCAATVREYCERRGITEVPVVGMDDMPLVLHGTDGKSYMEVDGNVWMALGDSHEVAYVGTSRHGGHMVLRPLFVKLDGVWRNSTTGRETDFTSWKTVR